MKYVFALTLLVVGAVAAVQGGVLVMRWNDNMTQTPRVMPGERAFAMPVGSVPRAGQPAGGEPETERGAAPSLGLAGAGPEGARSMPSDRDHDRCQVGNPPAGHGPRTRAASTEWPRCARRRQRSGM